MNIYRFDVSHITKRSGVIWNLFSNSPFMVCCVLLAGCVASSTLPSQNVGVSLTPADPIIENQPQLAQTPTTPLPDAPANDGQTLSPAVKSALVPAQAVKEPALIAADSVASDAEKTELAKNLQPASIEPTPAEKPKKQKTFFQKLLAGNSAKKTNSAQQQDKVDRETEQQVANLTPTNNTENDRTIAKKERRNTTSGRGSALPGVNLKRIFGIDAEETEEFDEPIQVAGVANLARRGAHGLTIQRPEVKVGCFPRKLVKILKRVERRYGRSAIVTSGFRSKNHNRRVRGARNSTHTRCLAADIQVKGVSKWALAKYLRSLPERGGVGTYCYTKSVHIDIGSKRAWHHCKKRRRKKRRRS